MDSPASRLVLDGIGKRFPGVVALDDVSFDVRAGEVHALVGENGAGKSTLIKIACGLYQPDSGRILLDGRERSFRTPHEARDAGIAVIHQEVDLFPDLSVTENLLLGRDLPTSGPGWIDWAEARARARRALGEIGEELDENRLGLSLTAAERQVVAIAAALSQNAGVIIMDEPTASLAEREVRVLFESVRRLREKGVAVVYITHRLEEVFALADRVTVLRDGKKVWTKALRVHGEERRGEHVGEDAPGIRKNEKGKQSADSRDESDALRGDGSPEEVSFSVGEPVTPDSLVRAMVGREVHDLFPKLPAEIGEPVLVVEGLSDSGGEFHDISFGVRAGEILGLYGLIGSGRSETAQAIFGLRELAAGNVRVRPSGNGGSREESPVPPPADGPGPAPVGNPGMFSAERAQAEPVGEAGPGPAGPAFAGEGQSIAAAEETTRFTAPRAALAAGIAYVPEDRLVQGLFLGMNVRENATIAVLRRLAKGGYVTPRWEREPVRELAERVKIKGRLEDRVDGLSGGNQQKVVLARWLLARPRVLILDEPTRGVDVGAKAEIHRLVSELAGSGMAVVLISSELPEILGMSDRVAVFREGTLAGILPRAEADEAGIGELAFPRRVEHRKRRAEERAEREEKETGILHWLGTLARRREFGIAAFALVLLVVLTVKDPSYLSMANVFDTLRNISTLGIAAVGMTMIILAGGIDISVGSMLAVCAASAGLAVQAGIPPVLALAAAVLVGGLAGTLNGGLSVLGRVHPIIVTLGTMSIFRGLVIGVTGGKWITGLPDAFTYYGRELWLGVPIPVVFLILAVVFGQIFLSRTEWGRYTSAVGSNPRAARVIGIPVWKTTVMTFILGGLLTGLGSALYAARMGNIQTNSGQGFELEVIAAVVIGGTNIMGGSGTVIGAFLGALLLELVDDARGFMGISEYYVRIVVGVLILLAVSTDVFLHRRYRKRKR